MNPGSQNPPMTSSMLEMETEMRTWYGLTMKPRLDPRTPSRKHAFQRHSRNHPWEQQCRWEGGTKDSSRSISPTCNTKLQKTIWTIARPPRTTLLQATRRRAKKPSPYPITIPASRITSLETGKCYNDLRQLGKYKANVWHFATVITHIIHRPRSSCYFVFWFALAA